MNLGDKEREHGLSDVGFSKATKLSHIGIAGGIFGTRITIMMSQMKEIRLIFQEDKVLDGLEEQKFWYWITDVQLCQYCY